MFSYPEWDDYKSMSSNAAIAHIIDLGYQRPTDKLASRQYAHVVVNFVEDCRVAKDQKTLDCLLLAVASAPIEPEVMVTVLRCTFSTKNSLNEWYKARDKIYLHLVDKNPERGADVIMRGLMEAAPQEREEMDGLDAWQSLLKEAKKYQ